MGINNKTNAEELLSRIERTACRVHELHQDYMGRYMPQEVYDAFASMRDEDLPRMRKELLDMIKKRNSD